jgi:1-acyl-sn-glycerol-3-phosphate acyltransferase
MGGDCSAAARRRRCILPGLSAIAGGRLAGWILRRWGWTVVGAAPAEPRYVLVAAPHGSNWDAFVMLLCARHLGVRLGWLGKAEAFVFPLGLLLRRLGGIAVDRDAAHGLVPATVEAFRGRDRLALAVAPDGTRRYRDHWKSGFYHIAVSAGVPVVLGFLDWGTRRTGVGPTLHLSGDVRADMDHIRAFYAGMVARHPDKTSAVRLAEEGPP